jgi:hypothetical protein
VRLLRRQWKQRQNRGPFCCFSERRTAAGQNFRGEYHLFADDFLQKQQKQREPAAQPPIFSHFTNAPWSSKWHGAPV